MVSGFLLRQILDYFHRSSCRLSRKVYLEVSEKSDRMTDSTAKFSHEGNAAASSWLACRSFRNRPLYKCYYIINIFPPFAPISVSTRGVRIYRFLVKEPEEGKSTQTNHWLTNPDNVKRQKRSIMYYYNEWTNCTLFGMVQLSTAF